MDVSVTSGPFRVKGTARKWLATRYPASVTMSTDLETGIRSALTTLLQLVRTDAPGQWVSDAVADIVKAAAAPSGMVTADGPEAVRALAALKERAEEMTASANEAEALIAEMLGSFSEGRNGWSARVSAEKIAVWREGERKVEQWRERIVEEE